MKDNQKSINFENQNIDPVRAALERDVYRLEVLGEIKQAVLVDQSPRRFAETAFKHLKKIIPYDHASVILFNFKKKEGWVLAAVGEATAGFEPGNIFPLEDCLTSPELLSEQVTLDPALLVPQPSCLMESRLRTLGIQNYISHLLISHGELIGTLNIASYQQQPYDEQAIRIARDVADSLAVAIQKAMLFEQARAKAAELEAISKLSSELRRTESWDAIISIVREEAERVFNAERSWLIWRDGEYYRVVSGPQGSETFFEAKRSESIDQQFWEMLDNNQPVFLSPPPAAWGKFLPGMPKLNSSVLLPLKTGTRLIGKLVLGFQKEREFTDEDQRLLISVADIAGNALYRANVMETLEERVTSRTRELATLYNISNTINQSLDLIEVLERSLEFLKQATGAGTVVHLLDEKAQTFVQSTACGLSQSWKVEAQRLAEIVVKRDCLVQFPPDETNHSSPGPIEFCYVGLPLKGRDQTLGVLSLLYTSRGAFGEDALSLLSGVAGHLSIAIQHAQLRHKAEESIMIEERQRLARELHDSISQLLYSQLLFAQAGQRAYDTGDLELLPLYLNRLVEVAEQAFKEMRLMIYSLRPQVLESVGLVGALQQRLKTVENRTGLDTKLIANQGLKLPNEVEETLFRIAQEALNNTLKHASATAVEVRLETENDQVTVTITDNGKGFDQDLIIKGVGFDSMHERARQLGGWLTIQSQPGQGTIVLANIPLSKVR